MASERGSAGSSAGRRSRPRVTVLGGFLGAGKTTLLNAILRHTDHRFAVIVNDFGAINVDAALVSEVDATHGEVALSNGCICCSIREDLLEAVCRLCARTPAPEHILIETSGVSDPAAIANTFGQPGIEALVELNAIIVAVDPESYIELTGADWRLARHQVAAADLVVLTKVDLVSAPRRQAAKALIRQDVPRARIVRSSRDHAPVELLLGTIEVAARDRHAALQTADVLDIHVHDLPRDPNAAHDHHASPHALVYSTWCFRAAAPLSPRKLRKAIAQIPADVFRIKGIVALTNRPDDRVVLQVVGRRAELYLGAPWRDETPRSEIVVIGHEGSLEAEQLQRAFEGCVQAGTGDSDDFLGEMLGYFSRLFGRSTPRQRLDGA